MDSNSLYLRVKHTLFTLLALCFSFTFVGTHTVHAVATSILPDVPDEAEADCEALLQGNPEEWQTVLESYRSDDSVTLDDAFLGCAIKTGQVKFWMIPYFVNYVLEFLITVAGVLVVLMIIIGGYFYIYGAITEDKEKGKTIITYAIGGYVLILSSWFIVNAILLAVSQ